MSQNATPPHPDARTTVSWQTGVWRVIATLAVAVLILVLPLARHRVLLRRPPLSSDLTQVFPVYYEYTSFILYLSDVAVVLLLMTAALWWWRKRPATDWGPLAITAPLALLPAVALVTAPGAGDPALAVYIAGRLVVLLALYLALVALRPAPQAIRVSLAASLMLQTGVAMAQFVLQRDLGWHELGEIPLSPTPGMASIVTVGSQVWLRGYGLTPHPNILGGILVVMLLALIVPYLESHGWRKVVWLTILAGGGVGLAISFSRAAWLGGVAGGAVLLVGVLSYRPWRRQYARALLVPAVVGLVVLAGLALVRRDLFLARLQPPTTYTEARSLDERRVLADASLTLIRRSPLTGVGAGNFSTAVMPLVKDAPATTPQPVHNLPLLLSAELGVVGGILWTWLMLAPPVLTFWRMRRGRGLSLWTLGLTAGLVALAVIDLFDFYSWGWPQGRLLRWTFLGLWAGALDDSAG